MNEVKRYTPDMQFAKSQVKEDADGELCLYRDYTELKKKFDALAAENAALISAFSPKEISTEATDNLDATAILKIDGDEFHSWQWIDNQGDVIRGVLDFFKPNTPATDAYLNSVRAEGVELVKEHPAVSLCSLTHVCEEIAAQLRAGKDGE